MKKPKTELRSTKPPAVIPPADQLWLVFQNDGTPAVVIPDEPEFDDQSDLSPAESKKQREFKDRLTDCYPQFVQFCQALRDIKAEGLFRDNHSAFHKFAVTWGLNSIPLSKAMNTANPQAPHNSHG